MPRLPTEAVSAVITSPPYNIGKEYESFDSLSGYIEWSREWLSAIPRILDQTGSFWLNIGYTKVEARGHAVPLPYLLWDKVDLFFNQEIVWNYGAGVAARKYLSPRNEKILWYVKDPNNYNFFLDRIRDPNVKYPNQKKNGKLRCNPLGKNPSDVWQLPKVTSGKGRASPERTSHPAQFPVSLIERIMLASTNEGDIVLDPFMGSGTTAEVAMRLNRKFIGFEISEAYMDIARKRLCSVENEISAALFQTR
tara:strand:+ start:250 stop:1002 length:753 start_codon:yes stop_codon:yes gene_type:complete